MVRSLRLTGVVATVTADPFPGDDGYTPSDDVVTGVVTGADGATEGPVDGPLVAAGGTEMAPGASPAVVARLRAAGPAVTTAGVVVVAIAAFLPWVSTGTTWRSSFGLVRGLQLIGYADGGIAWLLRIWYFVPALAAGVWLAAFLRARRVLVALASSLVVITVAVASAVVLAPVRIGLGPWLALAGALAAAVGVVLTIRHGSEPR